MSIARAVHFPSLSNATSNENLSCLYIEVFVAPRLTNTGKTEEVGTTFVYQKGWRLSFATCLLKRKTCAHEEGHAVTATGLSFNKGGNLALIAKVKKAQEAKCKWGNKNASMIFWAEKGGLIRTTMNIGDSAIKTDAVTGTPGAMRDKSW